MALVPIVPRQWEFLQDVAKLIIKAKELGLIVTGGELYRPLEMQRFYIMTGKSMTMDSKHLSRMAIDFNFFITNSSGKSELTWSKTDIQPLGLYWESLNILNRWGGNWKTLQDVGHFERGL